MNKILGKLIIFCLLMGLVSCSTTNPPINPPLNIVYTNSWAIWNPSFSYQNGDLINQNNIIYDLQITDLNTNIFYLISNINGTNQFIGNLTSNLMVGEYELWVRAVLTNNIKSVWTGLLIYKE